ncbi:MAG: hypothetical protein ACRDD5_04185 [Silvania sp.]|uniref:hypothetical protein n=1 Tax=Silvania sp. TaxID=3016633 RepID=UPI003EE45CFE
MDNQKAKLNQDQIIEYLIKSIIRTDGYLNYSNTKSTVILTLSAAFLTLIASNFKNLSAEFPEPCAFLILKATVLLIFICLITSIYLSITAITPFTGKSKGCNTFSFVDVYSNYDVTSYELSCLREMEKENIIKDLSRLHYNLAESILIKYQAQKKSMRCIKIALLTSLLILVVYVVK